MLREAEARAAKIREGADALRGLRCSIDLDARLSTALGSVKKGIEQLALANTARNAPATATAAPAQAAQPLAEAAAKSKRAAFDAQAEPANRETAQLESV